MLAEPLRAAGDERLLALAADGDGEAFAELYRRLLPLVLAYLRRQLATPETAADLAAETFVAALESLRGRDGPPPPNATAWLIAIARNKLIDSVRRGRVQEESRRRLKLERLVLEDADLAQVEAMAASVDVQATLQELLPEDQLAAVQAHVLEERDYEQIAIELKTSNAVIRKRVSRGLTRLRRHMAAQRPG